MFSLTSSTPWATPSKTTTIVPMLNKSSVSCYNRLRPTTLIPIIERHETHLDSQWTPCRLHIIRNPQKMMSSPTPCIWPSSTTTKRSIHTCSLQSWACWAWTPLWILMGKPQSFWIGSDISSTKLSSATPQGCVLSPVLIIMLTHDCIAMHSSND